MGNTKNLFLAIVLSLLFVTLYSRYFMPPPPPGQEKPPVFGPATMAPATPAVPGSLAAPALSLLPGEPRLPPPTPALPLHDRIVVENEEWASRWTNQGAGLKELQLKHYFLRRPRGGEDTLPLRLPLLRAAGPIPGFALELVAPLAAGTPAEGWKTPGGFWSSSRWEVIPPEEGKPGCGFRLAASDGLQVSKTFRTGSLAHEWDYAIVVRNQGISEVTRQLFLYGPQGILSEQMGMDLKVVTAHRAINGKPELDAVPEASVTDDGADRRLTLPLLYTGLTGKYFTALLFLPQPGPRDFSSVIYERGAPDAAGKRESYSRIGTAEFKLKPGEEFSLAGRIFIGPMTQETLARYEGMSLLVDYGWFDAVSRFLMMLLNFFHRVVGNFGVAIILLTVVVRLLLFPLSRHQQASMQKYQEKMRVFQPEMNALKEKFKNNSKKMNEEMMKLMKQHGVNPVPLGGCLPMFLQLPVFIGLWRLLDSYIGLRQAPFCLWMQDLSQPDRLLANAIGGYDLNLLPLLMMGAMFWQQRSQPKPADPQAAQQQKMMGFMFIFMGLMFYGFASGLTLYWLVSTLLGIAEQKLVKKYFTQGLLPGVRAGS